MSSRKGVLSHHLTIPFHKSLTNNNFNKAVPCGEFKNKSLEIPDLYILCKEN